MMRPKDGPDAIEIPNTGLRPNWTSFWALQQTASDYEPSRATPSMASCKSGVSAGTYGGIRHVRLITGSEWIGEWDRTGMTGMGMYKMPHGVIYEGTMKCGLFEGVGVLKYPNGSFLEGLWYQGKLNYWQYDYADGLERDCHDWKYCSMPDRRFFCEQVIGFRPANKEQMTNDHPARELPPGHYDVGQGYFNPKTGCVVDAITGEVLSIPTADEVKWILEKCRTAEPSEAVGYRPDLYENWFASSPQQSISEVSSDDSEKETDWDNLASQSSDIKSQESSCDEPQSGDPKAESEKALAIAEKEILSLLQQDGGKLQPMTPLYAPRRRHSLHEKLEGEPGQEQLRVASFEGLLKKILKEFELQKQSVKSSEDSDRKADTISNDSDLFRLTQMINIYAETSHRKKTASSSLESGGALEQFRIIGKLLPLPIVPTSASKQFPYSHPAPATTSSLVSQKVETFSCTMSKENKSEESEIISTNYESCDNDCGS